MTQGSEPEMYKLIPIAKGYASQEHYWYFRALYARDEVTGKQPNVDALYKSVWDKTADLSKMLEICSPVARAEAWFVLGQWERVEFELGLAEAACKKHGLVT